MMKRNDAIKLFLDKEGKELRGKHDFNFFVLVAIFAVAIFSIGFGAASIKYLQYKMDDPFINWVDIIVRQKISDKSSKMPLEQFLNDSKLRNEIQFEAPEDNYLLNIDFRHQGKPKNIQLQGRSIDSHSSILEKILDNSNVIARRGLPFRDEELGLIVTEATLKDLGYTEGIPAFIYLALSFDDGACEEIGIDAGVNGNYPVAFPIVAVVKQLPGMNSFLFSKRFLQDCSASNKTSFDITEEDNNRALIIVGNSSEVELVAQEMRKEGYLVSSEKYSSSWDDNLFALTIETEASDENAPMLYNRLFKDISVAHPTVTRTYEFQPIQNFVLDDPAYYSVQIKNLTKIKMFQARLYEECGIKLEMTSVDQKTNFQFVQRMGNILSICIILIAVLFICFFISFMLSTHFQRIQRNLGTFKAFGISNATLYYIYIILLLKITMFAFAIAFIFAWGCNALLNLLTKIENGYNWIEVLVWQNLLLLLLAIVASIIASYWVAKEKLQHTPGDLIYNRNSK